MDYRKGRCYESKNDICTPITESISAALEADVEASQTVFSSGYIEITK
jgi:hypothetical protein